MQRCEMCGKRVDVADATLCGSCAYTRRKQERQAAEKEAAGETPPAEPAKGPDLDDLRERLRRVQEGLTE
jgi:ribosome-binding protein aMBF1 (putative translation factor)